MFVLTAKERAKLDEANELRCILIRLSVWFLPQTITAPLY